MKVCKPIRNLKLILIFVLCVLSGIAMMFAILTTKKQSIQNSSITMTTNEQLIRLRTAKKLRSNIESIYSISGHLPETLDQFCPSELQIMLPNNGEQILIGTIKREDIQLLNLSVMGNQAEYTLKILESEQLISINVYVDSDE